MRERALGLRLRGAPGACVAVGIVWCGGGEEGEREVGGDGGGVECRVVEEASAAASLFTLRCHLAIGPRVAAANCASELSRVVAMMNLNKIQGGREKRRYKQCDNVWWQVKLGGMRLGGGLCIEFEW